MQVSGVPFLLYEVSFIYIHNNIFLNYLQVLTKEIIYYIIIVKDVINDEKENITINIYYNDCYYAFY